MNNRHFGNIFPLIRSALDREIQGLSFDAWYAVEKIMLKVVNWSFCCLSKIHIGEGMAWNSEVFWSAYFTKLRLQKEC